MDDKKPTQYQYNFMDGRRVISMELTVEGGRSFDINIRNLDNPHLKERFIDMANEHIDIKKELEKT